MRRFQPARPQRLQDPAHPGTARLRDLLGGPGDSAAAGRTRPPDAVGSLQCVALTILATARATWLPPCGTSPVPGTGSTSIRQRTSPRRWPGRQGELVACFQWLTPEESARVMDDPGIAAGAPAARWPAAVQALLRRQDPAPAAPLTAHPPRRPKRQRSPAHGHQRPQTARHPAAVWSSPARPPSPP
jgi:hypothetical protein